jgi:uncharacterized membrane protein HdeD (DUF308 family)
MKQAEPQRALPRWRRALAQLDFQDAMLFAGVVSIVGGIAAWSRPAAAIVFGIMCLFGVLLIERGKSKQKGTDGRSEQ